MLTGVKDTDILIMEKLDDRSLLNLCLVNRKANEVCNDEIFWYKRYIDKFGKFDINEIKKPDERTWRKHYLQTIIDLDRFSENPSMFLKYISWNGTPENSYFLKKLWGKSAFLEAPEWVKNNFYLLDLGRAYLIGEGFKDHVTPSMLFSSEYKDTPVGYSVNGPGYTGNEFWREERRPHLN